MLTTKAGTVILSPCASLRVNSAKDLCAHPDRPFAALRVTKYYRSCLLKFIIAPYFPLLRYNRCKSTNLVRAVVGATLWSTRRVFWSVFGEYGAAIKPPDRTRGSMEEIPPVSTSTQRNLTHSRTQGL